MKKILSFIFLLNISLALAEEPAEFIYTENGKKDPLGALVDSKGTLISYDSELTASDIHLEGIITDAQGNNLAILNGKVVKTGDRVVSYTVGTISFNKVELLKGQEQVVVKMKKGGV